MRPVSTLDLPVAGEGQRQAQTKKHQQILSIKPVGCRVPIPLVLPVHLSQPQMPLVGVAPTHPCILRAEEFSHGLAQFSNVRGKLPN